jgi:hypothetical protein
MVDAKTVTQRIPDYKNDNDIPVHEISDKSLERVADVERLVAVTLALRSQRRYVPS